MKKLCLSLLFIIMCLATSYSQSAGDPITTKKVLGGYQFYQGNKRLNMTQLARAVEYNAEAHQLAKSAKSNIIFSNIVGGVGGFMLGWNLGTAIGGGNPNWWVAGAGAALIVVSIPISNKGMRQAKSAAQIHNEAGGYGSSIPNKIFLSCSDSGAGLVMKF